MKRSLALFLLPLILFTYVSFLLFQKSCDYGMNFQAQKNIPFNHQSHLTKYGANCESCHGYYEDGRFKGLPTVAECVACHDRGASYEGDSLTPKRKAFLDKYSDTDKPWEAFSKQPDLAYFSHKVVMTAQYEDGRPMARCGSCHGDKENSMTTAKIKGKMLMGQCEDCHTAISKTGHYISNSCAVCHK